MPARRAPDCRFVDSRFSSVRVPVRARELRVRVPRWDLVDAVRCIQPRVQWAQVRDAQWELGQDCRLQEHRSQAVRPLARERLHGVRDSVMFRVVKKKAQ